jgi:hypothetical protein
VDIVAQLLFVILAILVAIGLFRCQGDDASGPATQMEQLQQTPGHVEQQIGTQVDAINQRNQELLNRP